MKLVSIPANPVPDKAVVGTIQTPDQVTLRFARFAPPKGRKGTICLFQGRTEFIEKYYETVRDLRARGFAVATLDWRGQGLSQHVLADRRKSHVKSFRDYEIDLETFMKEVVLPDCPPPYYALGHSMGAAVLLRMAYRGNRWFERMMLCTPLIDLGPRNTTPFARPIVRLMNWFGRGTAYIPGGSPTVVASLPFAGNVLTSDPVRHARTVAVLEAEPDLGLGSPTNAWAAAAFNTIDEFADPNFTKPIRLPVLLVGAGRDETVSTPAIEAFGSRLRVGSHIVIAGARHEVMMEADRYRAQLLAAFDAFIPGTPAY